MTDEDGGTKKPLAPRPRHPHPRPALPRNPRRGPHGAPALAAAAARAHGRRARAPRRALQRAPARLTRLAAHERASLRPVRRHDPAPRRRRAASDRAVGSRDGPAGERRPAPRQHRSASSTTTASPRSTSPKPPTNLTEQVEIADDEPFVIHPGEFVLGRTQEWVELPDDVVAGSRASRRSAASGSSSTRRPASSTRA